MRRSLLVIAALVLAGSALAPTAPARAQFQETPQSHLEFGLNTFRDGFYEPAIDAFRAYLKAAGNRARRLLSCAIWSPRRFAARIGLKRRSRRMRRS